MTGFFASTAAQARLMDAMMRWVGTPFMHYAHVPTVGVDCVQLAGQVMVHCGVLQEYDFGHYSLDWSQHQDRSIILEWLEAHQALFEFMEEAPQIGDIACFRVGRAVHHCGVMINSRDFLHVVTKGKARISRLDDATWAERVNCFYRPKEAKTA